MLLTRKNCSSFVDIVAETERCLLKDILSRFAHPSECSGVSFIRYCSPLGTTFPLASHKPTNIFSESDRVAIVPKSAGSWNAGPRCAMDEPESKVSR